MARRLSFATGIITILAAVFALLLATSIPAAAHHKDGHDQGSSKTNDERDVTATSTEPDDDDDNRHPSGKDRETNNGSTDDTQGKSTSTPDQNGSGPERDYEGTDKPGGAGGMDKDDQDGNNGCGNDDDFEDDNEGWCGGKPKPDKSKDEVESSNTEKPCDKDDNMANGVQSCDEPKAPADEPDEPKDEVDVGVIEAPVVPAPDVLGLRVRGDDRAAVAPAVRGQRVRGGVLPFTGGDVLGFVFLALGLVAAGYVMLRTRRRV
jgi:hypothetical protein